MHPVMKMELWARVFSAILGVTLLGPCCLALSEDGEAPFRFSTLLVFVEMWCLALDIFLGTFVSGVTLLEVKSSLNDSGNFLSNWRDTDEFPCKWIGVSCYHHDHRVRSMYVTLLNASPLVLDVLVLNFVLVLSFGFFRNLPYMQLGGIISPSIGKLNKLQRL